MWSKWIPRSAFKTSGQGFDLAALAPINPAPVLVSAQAVQQLQPKVERILFKEFELGDLASRLCPVLLADNTVTVFATKEHQAGDALLTLWQQLQAQGYKLAAIPCYELSVTLLLELIRDAQPLNSETVGAGVNSVWSQADLFNAFLDIVRWGLHHQASDIHINIFTASEYSEVRFSIAGRYVFPSKFHGMNTRFLLDMLAVAWMNIRGGNGAVFDPHKEQQGSLSCEVDGVVLMLRWGSLAAELGPSICLRLLQRQRDTPLPELSRLGYLPWQEEQLRKALLGDGGAVIFSGAVGSGKSTTLASLVAQLPSWRKLISIEDPVEYLIPNAIQVALSRDLHQDSHQSFATKLRALKRAAMTDVLLGEIRDLETGRAFTDLSSSGVRLYTTVHAASAALVPARLHSDFVGVSMDLMAAPGILRLLVHQCLLPKLCEHCALYLCDLRYFPQQTEPQDRSPFQRWCERLVGLVGESAFRQMRVRQRQGCEQCRQPDLPDLAGWAGRMVCAELLEPEQYPNYLRALHTKQPVLPGLLEQGWRPLRMNALSQAQRGVIDPFDIERHFSSFETVLWQNYAGSGA